MHVSFSPPVLPLTPENVAGVFGVVPLTKKDDLLSRAFGKRLRIPEEYHYQPQTAARWYVNEGEDCSWRKIAHRLDKVNETGVSDFVIPYVEPPAGVHIVHEHFKSSYNRSFIHEKHVHSTLAKQENSERIERNPPHVHVHVCVCLLTCIALCCYDNDIYLGDPTQKYKPINTFLVCL